MPSTVAPERVASTVSRKAAIREPGVASETDRISMHPTRAVNEIKIRRISLYCMLQHYML